MWSETFRQLMRAYYGVDIGLYSYGPCLWPGHLPAGTRVGNYCSLAAGLQVLRRNHPIDRLSQHPAFFNSAVGLLDHDTVPSTSANPLIIGHDVWIGQDVLVTPSCRRIGDGAVVAARSVVTRDVPPLAIVAGVPARIIRWRFAEHVRVAWLESQWWLRPLDELGDSLPQFMSPLDQLPDWNSS